MRYTKEPHLAPSEAGESAPLTSDMTVDTEVTDLYSRTMSVTSRHSTMGPGWRSNMRGDYTVSDIAPVSTKDLLCWAYQVCHSYIQCVVI